MTTWVKVGTDNAAGLLVQPPTPSPAATPMSAMHQGALPDGIHSGHVPGQYRRLHRRDLRAAAAHRRHLPAVSARSSPPRIPVAYIGTVAVLAFLFPQGNDRIAWMALRSVFGGGLMLGAIFMATDYVTSPLTKLGADRLRHRLRRHHHSDPLLRRLQRGRDLCHPVHERLRGAAG